MKNKPSLSRSVFPLLVAALVGVSFPVQAASPPLKAVHAPVAAPITMTTDPQTLPAAGGNFSVKIKVAATTGVRGIQFDFKFNPAVVKIPSAVSVAMNSTFWGTEENGGTEGVTCTNAQGDPADIADQFTNRGTVSNASGVLINAASAPLGVPDGGTCLIPEGAVIATLTFNALANGLSNNSFINVIFVGASGLPLPDSDYATSAGSFQIGPAVTPAPTTAPTAVPTTAPTAVPTTGPTAVPTTGPTVVPTTGPTAVPTTGPTVVPTTAPTAVPTTEPTAVPTTVPTAVPTTVPTAVPTTVPTAVPTTVPTAVPTTVPTAVPTTVPTAVPTTVPTAVPTTVPTAVPTTVPTAVPTALPTATASPPAPLPTATPELPTTTPTAYPVEPTFTPVPTRNGLTHVDATVMRNDFLSVSTDRDINFGKLVPGMNKASGTINVRSNLSWQVTVSDYGASTNSGLKAWHLSQWNRSNRTFVIPGASLIDPLKVSSTQNTVSEGTANVLLTGGPAGQTNNGENFATTYSQNLSVQDKPLPSGQSYHIILNYVVFATL